MSKPDSYRIHLLCFRLVKEPLLASGYTQEILAPVVPWLFPGSDQPLLFSLPAAARHIHRQWLEKLRHLKLPGFCRGLNANCGNGVQGNAQHNKAGKLMLCRGITHALLLSGVRQVPNPGILAAFARS